MLIELEDALERIDTSVLPLPPQNYSLKDAVGCLVASDIFSPMNIPPFDNSSMDGIALRLSDLAGDGPWTLPIQRSIAAGDAAQTRLQKGYAVKIMTGAPLPEGADSILPVEEVSFSERGVHFSECPIPGKYVRPIGEDVGREDLLFPTGTLLKPIDTGVLAAVGLREISVIPRPSIAILSTGSEVIQPGDPLEFGHVYNSNDTTLESLLRADGFTAIDHLPPVADDRNLLTRNLNEALSTHDVVITSGGVSMGDKDYIPNVVQDLNGEVIFHKVRIKPGKPALLARFNSRPCSWLIGLPGNPVSVVVGYHLYARRVLRNCMHLFPEPQQSSIPLGTELLVTGKRLNLVGVRVQQDGRKLVANPALNQASGRPGSIRGIDGFIRVEPGITLEHGTMVNVEWLPGKMQEREMGISHLNHQGEIQMVDIGGKAINRRHAEAEGTVLVGNAIVQAIRNNAVPKGNVFEAARIAGIQAAKRTWELIPLCHQIPLDHIRIRFETGEDRIKIAATVSSNASTGVEMEALTAVSVAALTLYDMLKAMSHAITFENIRLLSKSGGKSGEYHADHQPGQESSQS